MHIFSFFWSKPPKDCIFYVLFQICLYCRKRHNNIDMGLDYMIVDGRIRRVLIRVHKLKFNKKKNCKEWWRMKNIQKFVEIEYSNPNSRIFKRLQWWRMKNIILVIKRQDLDSFNWFIYKPINIVIFYCFLKREI